MSHAELLIGDPAPPIEVESFLKGEPITALVPGTVYVVEFWATWCGPCKASIPHLSDLQKRHPEVPIIAVAVGWSDIGEVQAFVRERDAAIGYRIAIDGAPGEGARRSRMRGAWCDAAYERGVPTAFIVDGGGRVTWIGHPMDIDEPLAAVVEERWDLPAVAEAHRRRLEQDKVREARALERAVNACFEAGDRHGAVRAYDAAFAAEPALERTHGFGKFKQLAPGSEAQWAYAQRLIDQAAAEDVNTLFKLGTSLATGGGGAGDAALRRGGALAAAALDRVWILVGDEPSPSLTLKLCQAHAEALLAAGRPGEAEAQVRRAQQAAIEAGASQDATARLEDLADRCNRAASPTGSTAPRVVVCEGDTCRLADS